MGRFEFNRELAISKAWDLCWNNNLQCRASESPDAYGYSRNFYLTAADIENQVRAFADDAAHGRAWRTERTIGRPYSSVRFSGDLQSDVRRWLRTQEAVGRLTSHNFGKGHISGQRYRPLGEPLSEAEQSTFQDKKAREGKDPVMHRADKGSPFRRPYLCAPVRKWRSFTRSKAWTTSNADRVTCPRCLKLMKEAVS